MIGDDIVITILAIERDKVKIGIQAPRQTPIMRQEIYLAVQEQRVIVEKLSHETQPEEPFELLRKLLVEQALPDESPEQPPADKPQE